MPRRYWRRSKPYSLITAFVRAWRGEQGKASQAFVPLTFALGEAFQFDWSEEGLLIGGIYRRMQVAHLKLPTAFDGYVERPARVSSTCLVNVGRNRYSVPCEYAGKWVSSRLYPTRIEVVADDAPIANHGRLLDRDQVSYDWQHYIPLIERKPGALRNGAPFTDLPAPLRQLKHGLGRHAGGDRIMAQVLAAVPVAGLDAVLVAV